MQVNDNCMEHECYVHNISSRDSFLFILLYVFLVLPLSINYIQVRCTCSKGVDQGVGEAIKPGTELEQNGTNWDARVF